MKVTYDPPLPLEQEISDALTARVIADAAKWYVRHAGRVLESRRAAAIQARGILMAAIRPVLADAAKTKEPK